MWAETTYPAQPSVAFRCLPAVVRAGVLGRGYARILRAMPAAMWGGEDLVVTTEVGPMCVYRCASRVRPCSLFWGHLRHEERETRFIAAQAVACQTMCDIGAHSGWYSRVMAHAAGTRRVYAFEPNPAMFPYVESNVARAGIGACFPVAVSDRSGRIGFYRASNANLSSTVRVVGERIEVEAVTLDDFCNRYGISTVDFVKCDCEGGELAVLRGARRLGGGAQPPIWMIEVDEHFSQESGGSIDEIMAEIRRAPGLRIFTQDSAGLPVEIQSVSERTGGGNVFLVPEARLTQFQTASAAMARP